MNKKLKYIFAISLGLSIGLWFGEDVNVYNSEEDCLDSGNRTVVCERVYKRTYINKKR